MPNGQNKSPIFAVKFNPKNGVVTLCDVMLRKGEVIEDFLGFSGQLFSDANPTRFAAIKLIDFDIKTEEMAEAFKEDKDVSHLLKWDKQKVDSLWSVTKA